MDNRTETLALVSLGGVGGAVCRHTVTLLLDGVAAFPWDTLVANVSGAFLLGVLLYERRLINRVPARLRLVAGTGFLSSFTTYSTFAAETSGLAPGRAAAYVAATYGLGFLAILAGRGVARWLA